MRGEFEGLFYDFARSLGLPPNGAGALFAPRMEVAETDKEIEVSVELPGLERKGVDISLDGNVLTIRAEKKAEAEQKGKNVHLAERSYGVFYRALELPAKVDPSTVEATMSKGDTIQFEDYTITYAGPRMEVDAEVQDIIKFADDSPDPDPVDLYNYVYAGEWENRPELRGDPL